MRNYSGSFVTPIVVIMLAAVAVVALGVWAVLGADVGCFTKDQARARWPGAWLYWHGSSRCWDNQRGGRQVYSVNRNPLQLGKPPIDGSGNQARHGGRPIIAEKGPAIYYPELISSGGTSDNMLTPHVMSAWPAIVDFDTDPPAFIPWQQRIVSQLQKE
jgi:hypothetical protein